MTIFNSTTVQALVIPPPPGLPLAPVAYEQRYIDQLNNILRLYFNQISSSLGTMVRSSGGELAVYPYGAFQDTTIQTAPANTAQVIRFDTTDFDNEISLSSRTAVFVGSITTTNLTVTAITSGTIYLGMALTGGAITAGTRVVSQTSGTIGGVGVYVVSVSQSRASLTITGAVASRITVAKAGIYNLQWSGQFVNEAAAIHEVSIWLRKGILETDTDVVGSTGRVSINAKHGAFDGGAIASWNYFIDLQPGEYVELWWSTPDVKAYFTSYVAGTSPTRPTTASIIATMTFVSAIAV